MKTFDHVIVFGAGSSIAKYVTPGLEKYSKSLISVYRKIPTHPTVNENFDHRICEFDLNDDLQSFDLFMSELGIKSHETVLILNFVGLFGELESTEVISPELILETMNANLLPFLKIVKLLKSVEGDSAMIGFSGGGIGGPNLERASLGYLAGKGAMGFISEAISGELKKQFKSLALIAPGPYPSPMQEVVANSTFHEFEESREKSKKVIQGEVDPKKLLNLIDWVIQNPAGANGRILSALHDDPISISEISDFGFLRRVYKNA
jgi:NADP-dependent 3-hydroxy acid dehydrogenase YdfG